MHTPSLITAGAGLTSAPATAAAPVKVLPAPELQMAELRDRIGRAQLKEKTVVAYAKQLNLAGEEARTLEDLQPAAFVVLLNSWANTLGECRKLEGLRP